MPFRSIPRILVALLAAALAASLNLEATSLYGAGLSVDSSMYLRTAQSLVDGHGIPEWMVLWPPFYPSMLALGSAISGHSNLQMCARIYAALFHGLIVLASAWLLDRQRMRNFFLYGSGLIAVAVCEPLFDTAIWATSEATFVFSTLMALGFLDVAVISRRWKYLFLAAVFSAAATVTRYIGVTLILTGGFVLIFWHAERQENRRFILPFLGASTIPLVIWVIRNHRLTGTLTGTRSVASSHPFHSELLLAVQTVIKWPSLRIASAVAFGTAVLFAVNGRMKRVKKYSEGEFSQPMFALLWFSLIFIASIAILECLIQFDEPNFRLMIPVTGAAFLYMLAWCDRLVGWMEEYRRWIGRATAAVLSAILIVGPLSSTFSAARADSIEGAGGFNTRYWHEHPLINYVSRNPTDRKFASNTPEVFYLLLGKDVALTPKKQSDERYPQGLDGTWPEQPHTLLAWFGRNAWRSYLVDLDSLSNVADMQLVMDFSDAVLLDVSPHSGNHEK